MPIRDVLLPHSIVLRTSLLFALLTAVVITVMGLVVRVAVDQHFADMDRSQMAGKLELIQHTLAEINNADDAQHARQALDRALVGHHDLLVRIDDTSDQLWYEAGHHTIPPDKRTSKHWEADGTPYHGMTATTASGYRITVSIDTSHHQQFLRAFERELLVIGLCGLGAMAMLGFLVTRRGLAPVQSMTGLVARSSAQQLGERLIVNDMPVELRELAAAFNDMLERISESLTRLSGFSSDLAHELRTPINNLMIQTQVSLSRERSANEYKEILYTNYEEYERLARMIGDMLFLAKADHGLIIPHREQVSLDKEIRALCDFYGVLAEEKNVQLLLAGQAVCTGDALMLRRAFGNLLGNAIQHANPHTHIDIAIEKNVHAANIRITNQGNTISPEHLPRLFDRFYRANNNHANNNRANNNHTKLDDGAGLGLAITQSIVHAHGGHITAHSADNVTQFMIELPA